MLVKLISFFSASDISTFHGIAEYSLHPVRQKMVTFNHQLGQDQERVASEMRQQLNQKSHQRRQASSSWKSKKCLQQKQDGRKRRKRVSEKRVLLDKKSYCAKLQVKQSHGEIGHYLQSKPAKDSSLRFVALCGEFNDPLDEEGGQVLQAGIKPDTAIGQAEELHIVH